MTARNLKHKNNTGWRAALLTTAICLLLIQLYADTLWGARIKDIAHLQGTRSEQLIGYGLVVGLAGTGDGRTIYTNRSTASLLSKFGVQVEGNEIQAANVAAVMVTAELNSFVKPGSRIDVTVSSIGECESLQGGTLLRTQLFGYDGTTLYAVCQGPVSIGGFNVGAGGGGAAASIQRNHTVVGRIPSGAQVITAIECQFIDNWQLMLTLDNSDFSTAFNLDRAIDDAFKEDIGVPIDGLSVYVKIPTNFRVPGKIIEFISILENLEVEPEMAARIVINERTGTIVVGEDVTISPVQVAHGGLTITLGAGAQVSQPSNAPLAGNVGATAIIPTATAAVTEEIRKFKQIRGTANELVTALNQLQVTPRDIIAIFQAIKEAGALSAELVIM
ncbi:MAG: flagellar basal body P-ring protein FlgI [Gemmatimonadota bacterium]|nr:flagellar basal body P-ring protein FlgI [Gemmatimonadota bacterium]